MTTKQKRLKTLMLMSAVLGVITTAWLMYNYPALRAIQQKVPEVQRLGNLVSFGLLLSFFFHLVVFVMLFFLFRCADKVHWSGIITASLGIISFFWLFVDWAALTDIGHDYFNGYACTGEWRVLYLGFLPHLLFYAALFVTAFLLWRDLKQQPEHYANEVNEAFFSTLNIIGMIGGGIGLGVTFGMAILPAPVSTSMWRYYMIVVLGYCGVVLLPYSVLMGSWYLRKRKHAELYDEKQQYDVARAGTTTWLLSLLGMAGLFAVNFLSVPGSARILWFPYYLFLTLLTFSGSTLYYFKKS